MALLNISGENNVSYNHNENSPLLIEESYIRLRKGTNRKRCDYEFSSEAEK